MVCVFLRKHQQQNVLWEAVKWSLVSIFFQIQFDCIIQIQNSQCNVSVVSGNSNMIILHLLRLNFTKTWYCMDDISLRNSLWWKKPSGFNFCSMGKTKKVVILPFVIKTAGKKNIHNYWNIQLFWQHENWRISSGCFGELHSNSSKSEEISILICKPNEHLFFVVNENQHNDENLKIFLWFTRFPSKISQIASE